MDDEWQAFREGLIWRPIEDYDRVRGEAVMLSAPQGAEDFGYWGVATDQEVDDPLARVCWRYAGEFKGDAPMLFEPTAFAEVDDDWRVHLMAD